MRPGVHPDLWNRADRPSRHGHRPGPGWVHEIKHDGFRLMVRRDGVRVRCSTRNGHDWADRFPAIVEAAGRIKASSFLIDGEAVICRDEGLSDFNALRSRRRNQDAMLFAFDLIEHEGEDLRVAADRPQATAGEAAGQDRPCDPVQRSSGA